MHFCPRRHITALFATIALARPAVAQIHEPVDSGTTAATTAAIHRLLELTGTAEVALHGVEAMVRAQRTSNPQIPPAFWDALLARARRQMPQYVDSLIPIYRAHLTRAEVDQLVKFYESPIGRRVTEVTPVITQESMELGQRWGLTIGREVGDSLAHASVAQQDPQLD